MPLDLMGVTLFVAKEKGMMGRDFNSKLKPLCGPLQMLLDTSHMAKREG